MKKQLTKLLMLLGVFLFLGAGSASAWTVYYTNPKNWSTVYVKTFNGQASGPTATNTYGAQMTKVNNNLWKYENGTGSPDGILFNNGSWGVGTNQTGNFTFFDGATYNFDGLANDYYMISSLEGWNVKSVNYPLTKSGSEYTIHFDNLSKGTGFKFAHKNNLGGWGYLWGANSKEDVEFINYGDLTIKQRGADNTEDVGGIKAPYDLTDVTLYFKPDQKQLYVQGYPTTLYLYNTNNGASWNWGSSNGATVNNGTYTWNNVKITKANGENGCLLFSTVDRANNWNAATSSAFGPNGNNDYLNQDGDIKANKGNCYELKAGTYNITVDLKTMKVTYTLVSSGTNSIYVVGDGNGLSYNLPGKEIKANAQGNFVFSFINGKSLQISTSGSNNWDDFKNNKLELDGGQYNQKVLDENGQDIGLKKENNQNNITLPWYGEYTITVKGDVSSMNVVTKTPKPDRWEIEGAFFGTNGDVVPMMQDTENPDIWRAAFIPTQGSGYFGLRNVVYGGTDVWYGNTAKTELTVNNKISMSQTGNNPTYKLDNNKLYTFTWNSKTKEIKVEESQAMYLYGHIQKGSWDKSNYVELTRTTDGKYVCEYLVINGRWNAKDVRLDGNRTIYTSTGDECYVALYPTIVTSTVFCSTNGKNDMLFDEKGSNYWKFGSLNTNNNSVNLWVYKKNDTNSAHTPRIGDNIPVKWLKENETNNFVISPGFYKVTADVVNGTVTFEEVDERKDGTYVWCFGDDDNPDNASVTNLTQASTVDGVPHYTHSFRYGNNQRDVVQVKFGNSAKHPAARQVTFEIGYKGNYGNYGNGAKSVKRSADAPDLPSGFTEVDEADITYDKYNDGTVTETQGSDDVTDDSKLVTIIGSSDFDDNHLIRLNQLGQYYIVAHLSDPDNARDVTETVYPATLLATVSERDITLSINGSDNKTDDKPIVVPFNTQNDNAFNGLLAFSGLATDATISLGTDFTVTIEPKNVENWVTESDYGDTPAAAYEKALAVPGSTLFKQYSDLNADKVDGFFTTWNSEPNKGSYTVNATTSDGNTFDVALAAPCSGIYTMTVEASGSGYSFTTRQIDIEIYPNLTGMFGTYGEGGDTGFNIDGYSFKYDPQVSSPDIVFSEERLNVWNKWGLVEDVNAFIPGTYFPDEFKEVTATTTSGTVGSLVKRNADNDSYPETAANYITQVNLKTLLESPSTPINIYIEKNGASHTYTFNVTKATNGFNPSTTEVDSIEAVEEGEAVYFNLQGVKVQNPEHGIYVKVQNGKASKVVL